MPRKSKNESLINILTNLLPISIQPYLIGRYFNYLLVIFAAVLGVYLNWQFGNILIFCLLIFYIIEPFPSLIFIKLGLISLISVPLLLAIHRAETANIFAILTFYFLALTVVSMITELYKEREKDKS